MESQILTEYIECMHREWGLSLTTSPETIDTIHQTMDLEGEKKSHRISLNDLEIKYQDTCREDHEPPRRYRSHESNESDTKQWQCHEYAHNQWEFPHASIERMTLYLSEEERESFTIGSLELLFHRI
jgi:DNA-directed RNA polymerase delta subunit